MVVCENCGGNCDNGELVQGVCQECIEKRESEKSIKILSEKMMNSPFYQMRLNLGGVENGKSYDFDSLG